MFEIDDTAYFIFKGDFSNGRHNNFYCLPDRLWYFPFMPVKITGPLSKHRFSSILTYEVTIGHYRDWLMPKDLLEKEFSFNKFILASLSWDGTVTRSQFESIVRTL